MAVKTTSNGSQSDAKRTAIEDLKRYPCFPGSQKESSPRKCVRIFNDTEKLKIGECHLISYPTLGGPTPMCTYDSKDDIYISASLQESGQFEGELVSDLVQFLKNDQKMAFLDLGCNIGIYTLAAAKLGRKVVAVDPMLENLRLLYHSLSLGKILDRVTIVWNAVSEDYQEVTMEKHKGNKGYTLMKPYDGKDMMNSTYLVNTIQLDDLIPLLDGSPLVVKMDIETKELSALLGGMKFLDTMDVRVIQMEWIHNKDRDSGKQIIDILSSKGFNAYRDIGKTESLNVSDYSHWPFDVYFI